MIYRCFYCTGIEFGCLDAISIVIPLISVLGSFCVLADGSGAIGFCDIVFPVMFKKTLLLA